MSNENTSITLTPKLSFILGLLGGVLAICTIGFVIVMSMMFRGDGIGMKKVAAPSAAAPSAAAPSAAAPSAAGDVGALPEVTKDDHVRGGKNASVTIVEYSDFECPFCSRFHPTVQQAMEEYGDDIRWVYRHFPLSFHPSALPAANAAECAGEQGKFWEYADELFANQASLGDALYTKLAGDLKLNMSKFNDCVASSKYAQAIADDQAGGVAAGVTGTPGSIIVGKDGSKQLVPGAVPYAQLKAMIDAAM
jgi:protein-disulfide isomerase